MKWTRKAKAFEPLVSSGFHVSCQNVVVVSVRTPRFVVLTREGRQIWGFCYSVLWLLLLSRFEPPALLS